MCFEVFRRWVLVMKFSLAVLPWIIYYRQTSIIWSTESFFSIPCAYFSYRMLIEEAAAVSWTTSRSKRVLYTIIYMSIVQLTCQSMYTCSRMPNDYNPNEMPIYILKNLAMSTYHFWNVSNKIMLSYRYRAHCRRLLLALQLTFRFATMASTFQMLSNATTLIHIRIYYDSERWEEPLIECSYRMYVTCRYRI